MKVWKILSGGKLVAYVHFSENDRRDTGYCALCLVRRIFNDSSICEHQILGTDEQKISGIPEFTLV